EGANRAPHQEFIDGRWVNAVRRGDNSVRKAHAPRQCGRYAVVTVAGEQAAHAPDRITKRGRGRAGVQKLQQRNSGPPAENEHCKKATEESPKPSEAIAIEELRGRMG